MGKNVMTDAACVANTARTGGDAMGSGNAGSVGSAGMTGGSESGSASSCAGGVEGGEVGDGNVGAGGDGGAFNGGVAGHDRGERSKSLSSSKSLRSSSSFRHFLVLLTSGGRSSGKEGGGSVADGRDTSLPTGAMATEDDDVCAGAARAAVAARPRRQRR